MTLVAPRRAAPTYIDDRLGECYLDTGRPVDEPLGTHVVLWIVEDPEAWASAIEAEGDAQLTQWPTKDRAIAEARRARAHQNATQVRSEGPRRTIYSHFHGADQASACVADLQRAHPNPGVHYELAEITAASACPGCHCPTIEAAAQWWHHSGRYPIRCHQPAGNQSEERAPGEWEINIGGGHMVCGYCDQTEAWKAALLGHARLTGFHMLGIERATGTLVVLAEAQLLNGEHTFLAHHCKKIPAELQAKYATVPELEGIPG